MEQINNFTKHKKGPSNEFDGPFFIYSTKLTPY